MKSNLRVVSCPRRALKGDLLVVPAAADCRGLSVRTYSKLGLGNGSTCRSDNSSELVRTVFGSRTSGNLVLEVTDVTTVLPPQQEDVRRTALLANVAVPDDGDSRVPEVQACTLTPLNVRLAAGFARSNQSWCCNMGSARELVDETVASLGFETKFVTCKGVDDMWFAYCMLDRLDWFLRDRGFPVAFPKIPIVEYLNAFMAREVEAFKKSATNGKVTPVFSRYAVSGVSMPSADFTSVKFRVHGRFLSNVCDRGAFLLRSSGLQELPVAMARHAVARSFEGFAEGYADLKARLMEVKAMLPKAIRTADAAAKRSRAIARSLAKAKDESEKAFMECLRKGNRR